jgi:hypothetical protein
MPTVTPSKMSLEKWMRIDIPNTAGKTLFMASGFAHFGDANAIMGTGGNDSSDQLTFLDYDVTDMDVGPHWIPGTVTQICPSVVAAGHSQNAPDEADGMGYETTAITKTELVTVPGGGERIRLHVSCKVRGGTFGTIPSLAYRVAAFGKLGDAVGKEGVFFKQAGF